LQAFGSGLTECLLRNSKHMIMYVTDVITGYSEVIPAQKNLNLKSVIYINELWTGLVWLRIGTGGELL
jgi:hypothetical protein